MSVTPQKLSSLSTSTLTAVLELTRSKQLSLTPSPSLIPKIVKNMQSLRNGILTLETDEAVSQEIMHELKKQYARLTDLCSGLNVSVTPLQVKQVQEEQLIDDDTAIRLNELQNTRRGSPLIPAVSIQSPKDDQEDLEDSLQDEATLRRANQEVMQMQQQMMNDQDDTLSALSQAIARQRDLSLNISSELEVHNNLLEETDHALDNTESRLKRAAQRLEKVSRRTARDNGATCIIVGLVVLLLILIVIFK